MILKANRPITLISTIIIILFMISSCTTTAEKAAEGITVTNYETPLDFSGQGYADYLVTSPAGGMPVFFGSVQRMSNRDDEAAAALLNASEQASKFIAVKAVSKFYTEKLNTSMRYKHDLDVIWDRKLAIEMIDRLEVSRIIQDTYGTYITAVLPDEAIDGIPWQQSSNGGVPSWTSRIPDIPGYIVSVGIALQTGYTADSFAAADDQALEDLARQVSVQLLSGRKLIENSVGTASWQTNLETSEVVIPGFYIIERWRTPDAHYYYSLAAAPASIIEKYKDD